MEHKLSPTAPTGRHGRDCRICLHPQREQIEQDFCAWESAAKIAKQYRIGSRTTIYRHARAFNLFSQRDRKVSMALGRIIERGANCRVTASIVVAACIALARLNSRGQLVTISQSVRRERVAAGGWRISSAIALPGHAAREKRVDPICQN